MLESTHPIVRLVQEDRRYKLDAYAFVFDALTYAQNELGMGSEKVPEHEEEIEEPEPREAERHLSGQQLCEAIRLYALEQYGYMAECVLHSWGVHSTSDFGEIVFNLIRIGHMRKTKDDVREDFDNVFDFETGLRNSFKITLPDA